MEDFICFTHEEPQHNRNLKPCGWNQCSGLRLLTSTAHVSYFFNTCAFIFSSVHILQYAFCSIVEDPFISRGSGRTDWMKGHIMHISCFITEYIWMVWWIKTFKWAHFAYIINTYCTTPRISLCTDNHCISKQWHDEAMRPVKWFYHSDQRDFTPAPW